MLGSDRCTWGPSYWCSELSTAKECGTVKHCIDNVWSAKDQSKKSQDSLCDFCHNVVKDAQQMMESNQTKAEIEQYLKQACSLLPDQQLQDMCTEAVDQYLPDILDMVADRLDPDTVCQAIGLCSAGKTARRVKQPRKSPSVQFGVDLCTECKTYIQQAKDILKDNTTEGEVEQFLDDNLCARLGDMEDMCKQMIKAYAPMIFQMLANDMDPEAICKSIGLCKKAVTAAIQAAKLRPAIKPIGNFEECELCKLVIKEAKTKAGQKEVETLIEDKLCAKLGSLQTACKEVVETYAPEIFQMIAQDLDADTVCRAIGFCKNATRTLAHSKTTPVVSHNTKVEAGPQCVLCEFVMKEVDGMLAKNATEAEILKALDEVCSILPATISAECKTFVDQYAPAIIILLANELDPKLVCTALGLCGAADKKAVGGSTTCEVCELAMTYLDNVLAKNATEQEIEKALDGLCSYLPSTYAKECDSLVAQYGPEIIGLIAHGMSPQQVCKEIGLCSSMKRLLGGKECTEGPSYWCASQVNAQKCGMVQHCKDHVWDA